MGFGQRLTRTEGDIRLCYGRSKVCNIFFEKVFISIQNLIYEISIALKVNELHTFERS